MSFVPLVPEEDDPSLLRRKEGFKVLNQFFAANDLASARAMCLFLLDRVGANIVSHPAEEKYRKLKKASKAYSVVTKTRGGEAVMSYLGFRDTVWEFQAFAVLRDTDETWLKDFGE